jgi:hypothetical protein
VILMAVQKFLAALEADEEMRRHPHYKAKETQRTHKEKVMITGDK